VLLLNSGSDAGVTLLRWIPPMLLLTGIGLYATIRSRVGVFGVGVTLLVWFALLAMGDALLPGRLYPFPFNYIQPWLWPFYPYLKPDSMSAGDYLINRLGVAALGINLITLSALQLRNAETFL
jgi:hypothetical protein